MSIKSPSRTMTRREALALGISGTAFLASGAELLHATDRKAAPPISAPDTEKVDFAVINRDRKWLDLESMATLEKSFSIDTPIGPSPLIRKLRYKDVPFY